MCVSGSYEPPAQLVPPPAGPKTRVPSGPSTLLTTGGVNSGPILKRETIFSASARSSGVKSMRSSTDDPWRSYAGGLVGNGCVAEYHSPGTSPLGTGRSSIGHIGFPVTRSNTYRNACLVGCATALMVCPLIVMSARSGAQGISISQMPWDKLEMPLARARVKVNCDETLTKQSVARTMAAIVIACG